MNIGKNVRQPAGYLAFVPGPFPSASPFELDAKTQLLHARASLLVGKLDGITQLLPDLDFFIFMYVRKEAARSSEIEGTKATMIDVIKHEAQIESEFPDDVDRILHYIKAMNYGLKRVESLPLSLRFIREVHKVLLSGTKDAPGKTPGEFRKSQNWIGGGSPNSARFVPPPVQEMRRNLGDLETFLHANDDYPPLVKAALMHAQFETIHPFLDGNGRTGRLLTTFYLCKLGILERPVLYLSEYFLNNQQSYYNALSSYHTEGSDGPQWLRFFFDGVAQIAQEAIETSKNITRLKADDDRMVQSLGQSAKSAAPIVEKLYQLPIVTVKTVQEWSGFTRPAANTLVQKLVNAGIIEQRDKEANYSRIFWHKRYLDLFAGKQEANQ